MTDIRGVWLQIARDWDLSAAQAEAFASATPALVPLGAPRCFCAALFAASERADVEAHEVRCLCASQRQRTTG